MTAEEFMICDSKELFLKTGIGKITWDSWFTGKHSPNGVTLDKAASSLNMPLLELRKAIKERRSRTIASKKSS